MHRNRTPRRSDAATPTPSRRRAPATIAVATALACVALAATAFAAVTTSAGTTQLSMKNVGETASTIKTTTAWTDLPGATAQVMAPADAVINARFNAQSLCTRISGSSAGTCSVRITANGVQLSPATSGTFAFDSINGTGPGRTASRSMERSIKVAAGTTYTVKVELKVTTQTKFEVSHWHLAVETSAP
jgi:hypothetical protein